MTGNSPNILQMMNGQSVILPYHILLDNNIKENIIDTSNSLNKSSGIMLNFKNKTKQNNLKSIYTTLLK